LNLADTRSKIRNYLVEIDYFASTMYEILFLMNITRILENKA